MRATYADLPLPLQPSAGVQAGPNSPGPRIAGVSSRSVRPRSARAWCRSGLRRKQRLPSCRSMRAGRTRCKACSSATRRAARCWRGAAARGRGAWSSSGASMRSSRRPRASPGRMRCAGRQRLHGQAGHQRSAVEPRGLRAG